jgi:hypothetical protein
LVIKGISILDEMKKDRFSDELDNGKKVIDTVTYNSADIVKGESKTIKNYRN